MTTNRIILSVLMSAFFVATANASEGITGVAVLDLQRAIMMSDAAKEQAKKLETQKDFAAVQKQAEALQKKYTDKQEALQKDGPTWTAEKRNTYLKEMEFVRKDIELATQKLQTQAQAMQRDFMRDMRPQVEKVLEQLVKDEKLILIVDRQAAIFAEPGIDITQKLVDRLNKAKQ